MSTALYETRFSFILVLVLSYRFTLISIYSHILIFMHFNIHLVSICLFLYSFMYPIYFFPIIHFSFIKSINYFYANSFIYKLAFIQLFINSFFIHAFIHSFICALICDQYIHASITSFIPLFIHSILFCVYPCIQIFFYQEYRLP